MKLGFELKCTKSLHFTPNHNFKMYIKLDEKELPYTFGQDTFDYNGAFLPDAIICATGRKALHKYEPDLQSCIGTWSVPTEINADDFSGMTLWLENNVILSQGELQTYYALDVIINGRRRPVSLLTTRVKVHWQGFGKYCIYLDSLNSML